MNDHQPQPSQRQDRSEPPMLPTGQSAVATLRAGESRHDYASTLRGLLVRVKDTCKIPVHHAKHMRDTTTMIRLSDEASGKVDRLIAAGVFKTRGETTAFLVEEGIKARESLFRQVEQRLGEIEALRSELRPDRRSHN